MLILKRLRGALATALFWAIAWSGLGMFLRIVWPFEGTALTNLPTLRMLLWSAVYFMPIGAMAGFCVSQNGLPNSCCSWRRRL